MTSPFFPLVRARRLAARPIVRRAAVMVLALVTGFLAVASVRSGDAALARWGTTRPVAVARHDLAAGDTVDGSSAEVRTRPEAVVPVGSLAEVPVGAVVRQPVVAGEPLVAARLAPHGLTGTAALVPPGQRAMAVPVEPGSTPPLAVGDLVDLLAVVPVGLGGPHVDDGPAAPAAGGSGEPAFPLVERAAVVALDEAAVSVAVPRHDAPAVAFALSQGAVALALAGP